ncbi:hypothetical protein GCM10017688_04220 [Streptomyces ramulosus]
MSTPPPTIGDGPAPRASRARRRAVDRFRVRAAKRPAGYDFLDASPEGEAGAFWLWQPF